MKTKNKLTMKQAYLMLVFALGLALQASGQATQQHHVDFSDIRGFSGYVEFTTKRTGFAGQLAAYDKKLVLTKYNTSQENLAILLKAGYDLRGYPESGVTPNENYGYEVVGYAYIQSVSSLIEAEESSKLKITKNLGEAMITPEFDQNTKNMILMWSRSNNGKSLWEERGGFRKERVVALYVFDLENEIDRLIREHERTKAAESSKIAKAKKQAAEEAEQPVTTDSDSWQSTGEEEDEDAEDSRTAANESTDVEKSGRAERPGTGSREDSEASAAREEYARQQAVKRRQRAIKQNYDNRIAAQQAKNTAIASSAVASSAGILVLLGGFMYQNMGAVAPEQIFTGSNFYLGVDFGYGINLTPVYFNSVYTTMTSQANMQTTEEVQSSMPLITNINFRLKVGYEHENAGGFAFGTIAPGASLIFHAFELSGSFGARAFGGTKRLKLVSEFETGSRSLSVNPWIDPEESGTGKTKIKFTNLKLALQLSWYSGDTDPARSHLLFGVINETINGAIEADDELGNYSIRNVYPKASDAQTGLFSLLQNDRPSYTGYWLEWRHDHYGIFTLKLFPKYPHTGFYSGGLNSEDFAEDQNYMYLNISYTRALDRFFH